MKLFRCYPRFGWYEEEAELIVVVLAVVAFSVCFVPSLVRTCLHPATACNIKCLQGGLGNISGAVWKLISAKHAVFQDRFFCSHRVWRLWEPLNSTHRGEQAVFTEDKKGGFSNCSHMFSFWQQWCLWNCMLAIFFNHTQHAAYLHSKILGCDLSHNYVRNAEKKHTGSILLWIPVCVFVCVWSDIILFSQWFHDGGKPFVSL